MPKQMHVYDERQDCQKSSEMVRGLNATLGLVIHGAADGIALGASSLTGKGNLGLIVFIAVLVHKGMSLPSGVQCNVHGTGDWRGEAGPANMRMIGVATVLVGSWDRPK